MNSASTHMYFGPSFERADDGWSISIIQSNEVTPEFARDISSLTTELCGKTMVLTVDEVQEITLLNDVVVAIIDSTTRKQIVGMAILVKMQLPQGVRLLVESVVVLPIGRKRGIASSILTFLVHHARSYSKDYLSLTCNPTRKAALRLYDALGFTRAKTNVYRLSLLEHHVHKSRSRSLGRYDDPDQASLAL
jgi:ribosomal protein S18 acetylase RimI-like enzyme